MSYQEAVRVKRIVLSKEVLARNLVLVILPISVLVLVENPGCETAQMPVTLHVLARFKMRRLEILIFSTRLTVFDVPRSQMRKVANQRL